MNATPVRQLRDDVAHFREIRIRVGLVRRVRRILPARRDRLAYRSILASARYSNQKPSKWNYPFDIRIGARYFPEHSDQQATARWALVMKICIDFGKVELTSPQSARARASRRYAHTTTACRLPQRCWGRGRGLSRREPDYLHQIPDYLIYPT